MSTTSSEDAIHAMWSRIDARDWVGLTDLLAEDCVVEWPASNELILGRDNFVAVQSEYPEGWAIRVLRVIAGAETVVSEVEVPHEGVGVFRAVSLWTVAGGKVTHGREYWISVGGDERPEWRRPLTVIASD